MRHFGASRSQGKAKALAAAALASGTLLLTSSAALAAAPAVPTVRVLHLDESSSGGSYLVTKGETVEIKLTTKGVTWRPLTVDQGGRVLQLVSEHESTSGKLTAVYTVVGYGHASFMTTGQVGCTTTPICPGLSILWDASVTSPVVDPPGTA